MNIAKNIALVIVSPKMGWEEVNLSGYSTSKVLQSAFYPMLALLAVASFIPMLYDSTSWTLAKTLMHSIIEFSSFFATYFLASYFIGGFYPEIVKTHSANVRLNNFIIYTLIYLVILEIFNNILDNDFSPIYFMLLYTTVIVCKGVDYLGLKDEKKIPKFVAVTSAILIGLPIIFKWLLEIMII